MGYTLEERLKSNMGYIWVNRMKISSSKQIADRIFYHLHPSDPSNSLLKCIMDDELSLAIYSRDCYYSLCNRVIMHNRRNIMSKEQIKYLSRTEQRAFLQSVKLSGSVRDECFYQLMLDYGCRTVELRQLEVKSLKLNENSLFIARAKNGVNQYYPLKQKTKKLIERWLKKRDSMQHSNSQYVFISEKSEQLHRITPQKSFDRYAKQAGISGHSPHSLRHSCAVNLLDSEVDLFHIKTWLGHKNISSTMEYLKISTGKKGRMMMDILDKI